MYKGYKVYETILHDYEFPETGILINAPTGCMGCDEAGQVLPGHSQCGITPADLACDENVYSRLEHGLGWILMFTGDAQYVDEWVENSEDPL